MRSLSSVAKRLRRSLGTILFITSHRIMLAAGVSVMGMNVMLC